MKIFSKCIYKKIFCLICFLILTSGCNQYSEGLQRRKFEFLYKMNNYSALFSEYTNGLTYNKDSDFYDGRMKKLYEDVNKMETIDKWGTSRILKENFLKAIDDNIYSLKELKKKNLPAEENIRKEYEVIVMNERADNFLKELNDEIIKVGKE